MNRMDINLKEIEHVVHGANIDDLLIDLPKRPPLSDALELEGCLDMMNRNTTMIGRPMLV